MERTARICSLLGVQSVADVMSRGRSNWFGHLEHFKRVWTGCRLVEIWRLLGEM